MAKLATRPLPHHFAGAWGPDAVADLEEDLIVVAEDLGLVAAFAQGVSDRVDALVAAPKFAGVGPPGGAFWGTGGEDGADGFPGAMGPMGPAGLIGLRGFDGADGDDGLAWPGPVGPIGATGPSAYTVVDSTATGATNDWAPGLSGHTLITWHGASDLALTGFAGGVSGQVVVVKNTGTTKVVTVAHNSGSSAAGNKLFNPITSGVTPIAPKGYVAYLYDGTQWQLVGHSQGSGLTPTFAAGDYTGSGAMTVTAESGDISTNEYYVRDNQVTWVLNVNGLTIGGVTDATIQFALPNGWTATNTIVAMARVVDLLSGFIPGILFTVAGQAYIGIQRLDGITWTSPQTNAAQMTGTIIFTIT